MGSPLVVEGEDGRFESVRGRGGLIGVMDYWAIHALDVIEDEFGDTCLIKPKNLLKFGRTLNADNGTKTTIAEFQGTVVNETYATGNTIDTVSSGSTDDTDIPVVIEGHTISGSALTFVTQTATLQGQNKVTLSTPLYRATRLYNATTDGTSITGPVHVYEDTTITAGAPNDATKTKLFMIAGNQQSEKCATAFSNIDYGLVTSIFGSVGRESNATANVDIELEVRRFGNVFRPLLSPITARTGSANLFELYFTPYLIIPKNADVRMVATSSADDTFVTAGFNSLLALVS